MSEKFTTEFPVEAKSPTYVPEFFRLPRTGERDAAYAAATSLAEIQAKAGRRTQARAWREQAERIKASA